MAEVRVWPAPLVPGDRVAVVAPSGPVEVERLRLGIEMITSWGLDVRLGEHVHRGHPTLSHLAASDADRAADFAAAWCDPQVRAVWAARGGYGAQRMVDLIDFDAVRRAGPKHLIGFSDITALHTRIGRELGQVTIHGPVAAALEQLADPDTSTRLRAMIMEPVRPPMILLRGRTMINGRAVGRLFGGNLRVLASDVGVEPAPSEPYVWVIEDVHEPPYRVDRMLTQLIRSGWFSSATGLVLGDLGGDAPDEQLDRVLTDRLTPLGIPVVTGVPLGHGASNLAVPLGAAVELVDGVLSLLG